jgi:hypothetical protein
MVVQVPTKKTRIRLCWSVIIYLFDRAAPCSYSLPVSAAPAVPFAVPLLLAHSFAASGLGTSFPPSVIFSVISLCTAVGSCSFSFCRNHWFFILLMDLFLLQRTISLSKSYYEAGLNKGTI